MQKFVHRFERAEKARETLPQMCWRFARRHKIAMPKQIRDRDGRRPHRTIFMRTLRPRNTRFCINPNRKPHAVLRPLREKHLRFHRLAFSQHLDRYSIAGFVRPQRIGEIVEIIDLVAVEFNQDVAGFEAGLRGG